MAPANAEAESRRIPIPSPDLKKKNSNASNVHGTYLSIIWYVKIRTLFKLGWTYLKKSGNTDHILNLEQFSVNSSEEKCLWLSLKARWQEIFHFLSNI